VKNLFGRIVCKPDNDVEDSKRRPQGNFWGVVTLCDRVFGRDGRAPGYQRSGLEKRAVLILLPYIASIAIVI